MKINMDTLQKFRIAFQVLAFLIFWIQLQEAFYHYCHPPIVQKMKPKPMDKIQMPVLYICNKDQYNYATGKEQGYDTNTDFMKGKSNYTAHVSWRGKNRSTTSKDMMSSLYRSDYEDLVNFNGKMEKVFVQPEGFCYKLQDYNIKEDLIIRSKQNLKVYVVDANRANNFMIEITDSEVDNMIIQPTTSKTYEGKRFKLSIDIFDNSVHNGQDCTDYAKLGSHYGSCLEGFTKDMLLKQLDCLPPWFPAKFEDKICDTDTNSSVKTTDEYESLVKKMYRRELHTSKCKPPCETMKLKDNKLYHKSSFLKYGQIGISFDPQVKPIFIQIANLFLMKDLPNKSDIEKEQGN